MIESHFVTRPLDSGGYAWTLTTRLGELLRDAEEAFGPRDKDWTVLGIEFTSDGPRNWYPGRDGRKHVVVQLSTAYAGKALPSAFYELAHEVIHLLAPSGSRSAPVIEEGCADYFAKQATSKAFPEFVPCHSAPYLAARIAVEELLDQHGEDAVRRLRTVEPAFHKMTHYTFTEAGLHVPGALINRLLAPFGAKDRT